VAQIAITTLSSSGLSQTHWLAKGLLVFSLTSALMTVYYATTQYRALGRLLRPKHVREWIRGRAIVNPRYHGFLPTWDGPEQKLLLLFIKILSVLQSSKGASQAKFSSHEWNAVLNSFEEWGHPPVELLACDPQDLHISQVQHLITPGFLRREFSTPSVA
jgi:hypothetical protein